MGMKEGTSNVHGTANLKYMSVIKSSFLFSLDKEMDLMSSTSSSNLTMYAQNVTEVSQAEWELLSVTWEIHQKVKWEKEHLIYTVRQTQYLRYIRKHTQYLT